jgi:hypothetical protein
MKPKTMLVEAAEGRIVTFPLATVAAPGRSHRKLRGAMPAVEKHGIEATPADPPVEVRVDAFVRKRLLAGDLRAPKTQNAAVPKGRIPTTATPSKE